MAFPIEPMLDRIFVKKDADTVTKSGFHLPETIKGRSPIGTVVAVGPGYLCTQTGKFIPSGLKVFDRVFVKQFDGYTIRYGEHEVHVFSTADIIGKIVGEEVQELSGGETNRGA